MSIPRSRESSPVIEGDERDDGVIGRGFGVQSEAVGARSAEEVDPGRSAHRGEAVFSVVRVALIMVAAIAIGILLNLTLIGRIEQSATQFKELSQFRYALVAGTAPISPVQAHHQPLALGTPLALLTIPSIGLKEVVDEGTNSQVLIAGPGHLPSTVFPGGLGTSVIYGRASMYGGPFARVPQLHQGARILVTMQAGPTNTVVFRVTDIRTGGQKIPPISAGGARLTLVTAKESMFVPSGVVYVDAKIVGTPLPTRAPVVTTKRLPADELPMGVDTGDLWVLALWLMALAAFVIGGIWTWHRRGHVQAWIIFTGPLLLIGYFVANQMAVALPNLM